jgi:hypothetical protein
VILHLNLKFSLNSLKETPKTNKSKKVKELKLLRKNMLEALAQEEQEK